MLTVPLSVITSAYWVNFQENLLIRTKIPEPDFNILQTVGTDMRICADCIYFSEYNPPEY